MPHTLHVADFKDLYLDVRGRGRGSFEHYHHFLLGFLVPLIEEIRTRPVAEELLHVRSCAVLDTILEELRLDRLVIQPREAYDAMLERLRQDGCPPGSAIRLLYGMDYPKYYDATVLRAVRDYITNRLAPAIGTHASHFAKDWTESAARTGGRQRLLFIDRGPPHPYYLSPASAKAPRGGAMRRSLPNAEALTAAALVHGFNLKRYFLEGMSFSQQIALFQSADAIIAQHGAALSNLIWTGPGLLCLEILPADLGPFVTNIDYFGKLCACLGLRHHVLHQESSHADIDPEVFLHFLRSLGTPG